MKESTREGKSESGSEREGGGGGGEGVRNGGSEGRSHIKLRRVRSERQHSQKKNEGTCLV